MIFKLNTPRSQGMLFFVAFILQSYPASCNSSIIKCENISVSECINLVEHSLNASIVFPPATGDTKINISILDSNINEITNTIMQAAGLENYTIASTGNNAVTISLLGSSQLSPSTDMIPATSAQQTPRPLPQQDGPSTQRASEAVAAGKTTGPALDEPLFAPDGSTTTMRQLHADQEKANLSRPDPQTPVYEPGNDKPVGKFEDLKKRSVRDIPEDFVYEFPDGTKQTLKQLRETQKQANTTAREMSNQ
ncbi:hypothetical protein [Solidesulfovibrio sp.]|uniref:hypothetical protein n=1 Tax=Solidesulfovibrio sp. TaxID=2910990 RepID=UPI00260907DD|nr:hypothetical protein [Solidesulfovibrio sp.]